MTVPTSHTSCQRNQVKSTNHGKTHVYISVLKVKYEAFSRNSWSKKKERTEFQTTLNDTQNK